MKKLILFLLGCFVVATVSLANDTKSGNENSQNNENILNNFSKNLDIVILSLKTDNLSSVKEGCTSTTSFSCNGFYYTVTVTASTCEEAEQLLLKEYKRICESGNNTPV
ncbi:MAG TPA: hypothetical protein PK110_05275 [Niabella sp.]|jgi:hypothetical protein|nr:hypothetical protein [Chitinophagaceae bacterium]HRN49664.1 hypothetical protein [Niabella sp.]HRO84216.1 hypothetical protein [Niabella sp.]